MFAILATAQKHKYNRIHKNASKLPRLVACVLLARRKMDNFIAEQHISTGAELHSQTK